jgi:hypothetical protein
MRKLLPDYILTAVAKSLSTLVPGTITTQLDSYTTARKGLVVVSRRLKWCRSTSRGVGSSFPDLTRLYLTSLLYRTYCTREKQNRVHRFQSRLLTNRRVYNVERAFNILRTCFYMYAFVVIIFASMYCNCPQHSC